MNSTASAITDGAGWVSVVDAARGNPAPSLSVDSTQTTSSQALAVPANDYYTFTITPNAGTLSLTTLAFDFANYTNDGTFPIENIFVRSSRDAFAANLQAATTVSAASAGAFTSVSISLSGVAFQNVTVPIEFRFYIYDGTTDADRGALLDNVVLNGTATIPEPTTYAMFFGGLGVLRLLQRRVGSKL